jgi:glycogen debranching enzyme
MWTGNGTLSLGRGDALYAWKGQSLLVVNPRGECGAETPLAGYYFREARHLRTLRLGVNGSQPWLCQGAMTAPNVLTFDYTFPELDRFGGGGSARADDRVTLDARGIPHRALDLQARYQVEIAELRIDVTVTNRALADVVVELLWTVDADFADLQEALAGERLQWAEVEASALPDTLVLTYRHPELSYRSHLTARGPAPWLVRDTSVSTSLSLRSQEPLSVSLVVRPEDTRDVLSASELARRESRRKRWAAGRSRFSIVGNGAVGDILRRQTEDLAFFPLMTGAEDEWLAPLAGVPLYPALFGRDAATGGWQSAVLDGGAGLDHTLNRLGRLLGRTDDPWRDEEPGRAVHQVRCGPLARLGLTPHGRYYGDFASPLMFIIGLAHLYAWTGNRAVLARHWDAARRVLDWARERGDRDGDGYLEYLTRSPQGPKHQGWKDSGDAVPYDDGTPVPAPIAPAEIQGYWFAAQQLMAALSAVMGAREDAVSLWRSAAELKERFNRDWWIDDEKVIALAMDPDKRLVRAPSSNMGQCLSTGIVSREHMPSLVGRLFAPDLFNGWGIRTLSSAHPSYNPIGYHTGSVWPVENATIVFGLRRFGFDERAVDLSRALFDLATLYPDRRVPECVGGYQRGERPTPSAYPRANSVQLWNATAYVMIMHSLLGLQPVAPLDLLIVDPLLPTWLPEVVLHNLRLGGATASLRFWRDARGDSHVEVLHRRGTLHVAKQPPPESLSATAGDRFHALLDRVLPV